MKNNKTITFLALAILAFAVFGCGGLKKEPQVEINHKIVGKWSGKTFDGANTILWEFAKNGEVKMMQNGKLITNEKYRLKDDKTVELETKSGTTYDLKIEFSDNDNTLTVADFTNIKTRLKRE